MRADALGGHERGAPGGTASLMQIARASRLYSALVFGSGFALGPLRVIWVVPRLGERTAELIEAPIMLGVIVLAARWVTRRLAVRRASTRLAIGVVALGLVLIAELTAVLWIRGLTIAGYVAGRDWVAGAVHVVLLGVFAVMPLLATRR